MMTTTTDAAHDVSGEATGKLTLLLLFALVFGSMIGSLQSAIARGAGCWDCSPLAHMAAHVAGRISPL